MKSINLIGIIFALFPATSNGEKSLLKTRKVSGKDGSCEKYHMKLHIYVCILGKGKKLLSTSNERKFIVCVVEARSNEDESYNDRVCMRVLNFHVLVI